MEEAAAAMALIAARIVAVAAMVIAVVAAIVAVAVLKTTAVYDRQLIIVRQFRMSGKGQMILFFMLH